MWKIFIQSGGYLVLPILIIFIILLIVEIRMHIKDKKSDYVGSVVFGFFLLISIACTVLGYKDAVKEIGKEYTMVVDVYYPNGKVERKTFTSTDEGIEIDYPEAYRISTRICTRSKTLLETSAMVDVVSYSYRER